MSSALLDAPEAPATAERFDDVVVPHLAAARRLARWLLRNDTDADDAVQEASLRALRYFGSFTGGNGRAWFLRIVRNTCWAWHAQRGRLAAEPFDEARHGDAEPDADPEARLLQRDTAALVARVLQDLPPRARALLVHREYDGLSYEELAAVFDMPKGTVMSGLSRARHAFRLAAADSYRSSLDRRGGETSVTGPSRDGDTGTLQRRNSPGAAAVMDRESGDGRGTGGRRVRALGGCTGSR